MDKNLLAWWGHMSAVECAVADEEEMDACIVRLG
jgi:hypothetical protein